MLSVMLGAVCFQVHDKVPSICSGILVVTYCYQVVCHVADIEMNKEKSIFGFLM